MHKENDMKKFEEALDIFEKHPQSELFLSLIKDMEILLCDTGEQYCNQMESVIRLIDQENSNELKESLTNSILNIVINDLIKAMALMVLCVIPCVSDTDNFKTITNGLNQELIRISKNYKEHVGLMV